MKLSISFIAPVLLMFTMGVQRPLILCFFSEKTIVLVGIYKQHLQGTFILMGVSENGGTPKSSILIGISIINHIFWGPPIFGNTLMVFDIHGFKLDSSS